MKTEQNVTTSAQLETQLDFLNFKEASDVIEQIAVEQGQTPTGLLFGLDHTQFSNEKHVPNQDRSRKSLESNIKKKGGDFGWIKAHELKSLG